MYRFDADEARRVFEWATENLERESGLGDLIFRVTTEADETVVGHIIERDGESSPDGVLLGAMPPRNEHHHVRWEDMVWIGVGYTE